jgi:hypothetical protein
VKGRRRWKAKTKVESEDERWKAKTKVESEERRGSDMEIDGQELTGKKIKENGIGMYIMVKFLCLG